MSRKIDLNKVLITGASGMVGSYIDFGIKTDRESLDITDLDHVMKVIRHHRPQAIIHLAAETDVDLCDRDPRHAYKVNSVGTYNITIAAKDVGAKLIYISTAGVFDGEKNGPYAETDMPNPKNFYGKSKHQGELIVRAMLDDYIIARACWMFGGGLRQDKKFVSKIIKQLDKEEIKAVDDAYGSPTFGKDLVEALKRLLKENAVGIFHLSNVGACSRYEVAKFIIETLKPNVKLIPVGLDHFPGAYRVKNEAMVSGHKLMRPWQDALKEYLETEWKNFHQKSKCGICGSKNLDTVLDLGLMPLANAFVHKEHLRSPEMFFPLAINFCNDCFSVQLSHVVNSELLYKNYHYETSANDPLVKHFNSLADEIVKDYIQSPSNLVVEIGSNDGSLLSRIKDRCRVLGVDPAQNIAKIAIKNNVPTKVDFFTGKVSKEIKAELGEAQVVIANNVMAHIEDIRGVFSAVKGLLSPNGRFIFEVHWVGNLINQGGFDQIYHEHIYYHSLHSLKHLINSLGMTINDIKLVPIHGESMRVYVGKSGEISEAVHDFLNREIKMGLVKKETYLNFSSKIKSNKNKLLKILIDLKKAGKKIFGYGAPAKGNTLLNYFQIGPDILDCITDTTPAKQGTFTPGMRIPVASPDILKNETPDYMLLLSWNYADAILEKERDLRKKGVKFIIAVPDVRIV
ncbi:MAG: sugar nucleotide-binding protein [Patescibacteria group bacterium]|nr:sugar nucleotide-binding protein [bacterium]MDZ4240729.1 sugar nucleotide-binding protein [Patescibacteria group bacterium]